MAFFRTKPKVSTDPAKIEALLTRAVERVYPSREFLETRLKSGERLSVYLGIDPTGPTLHLGHAIALLKLSQFQELGHQVTLLIGDFTGMIGDPTDKLSARKSLTRAETFKNAARYQKQASALLSFGGKNKACFRYNSEWHDKMSFKDGLGLLSNLTVEQVLKRDMFEERIKNKQPIYNHEFIYPLLQGYDSVAMNVDGEVGGNDQTFNMLVGRDLMKKLKNKEKFVLATKLLEDAAGKKMGKTEGNMVSLSEDEYAMFGKIMSWADNLIVPAFELCTRVAMNRVRDVERGLQSGSNPRDLKLELAREIVSVYHGAERARAAEENFKKTFSGGAVPENVETIEIPAGAKLVDILVSRAVVSSKSEFRRLVQSGAVSKAETGEKVSDPDFSPKQGMALRIGKHRFIKVVTYP